MNKSKFLKKSLAMVLAVMLVVAMIPLGASAASNPWLNDGTVVSLSTATGTLEGSAKSWTDTVAYNAVTETITVQLSAGTGYDTVNYSVDGEDAGAKTGNTTITFDATAKKVEFFASEGAYDADDEDQKVSGTYTITVVKPAASSSFNIASAKFTANGKDVEGTVNNSAKTITFTTPIGVTAGTVTATAEYPVDPANPDYTSVNVTVGEDATLRVRNQVGDTETFTIKTTEQTGLTSLTIGGVAAVVPDEEVPTAYTVTLPEGTDLTEDEQAIVYRAAIKTTATWNSDELISGKSYSLTKDSTNTLVLTDENGFSKTYTVTVKVTDSSDASITSFRVTATVTETGVDYTEEGTVNGDQLTVEMPKNVDLATSKVKFVVAEGASVTVGGVAIANDGTDVVDLTSAKVVSVTAADGTTAYYQLTATKAGSTNNQPAITAMKLTVGAGDDAVDYSATISGTTITFSNLPYGTLSTDVVAEDDDEFAAMYSVAKTFATNIVSAIWAADPFTGVNTIAVQSDAGDLVTYTVKYTKAAPKTGKTISDFSFTDQTDPEKVDTDNTYRVTVSSNKASVKFPYSYESNKSTVMVPQFTLSEGAVLYAVTGTTVAAGDAIKSGFDEEADPVAPFNSTTITTLEGTKYIVADEKAAYDIASAGSVDVDDLTKGDYRGHVTVLEAEVDYNDPETGHTLQSFSDEDGKVTSKITSNAVEITVPYSYATFNPDFKVSKMAKVTINATATELTAETELTVDTSDEENPVLKAGGTAISELVVTNEADSASTRYVVTVKIAPAKTEAFVTSLTVNNTKGVINNTDKTIVVNLPFNTDLTHVTVDYTVSDMAYSYDTLDTPVTEDEVDYFDVTEPFTVGVMAEDGNTINVYTVTVAARAQFIDVPESAWYYNNVYAAAGAGIVSGYEDGTFRPNGNISRQEFASMLVRMLGVDTTSYTNTPFTDVGSNYATSAIGYLADNGIMTGDGNGKFRPTASITRQEAASTMARALKLTTTSSVKFADDSQIASWAKTAVYACKEAKVFVGDNANKFNPKKNITRAEAATVMVSATK